MLRSVIVFCCVYATLTPNFANAISDEEKALMHAKFDTIGKECMDEHVLTEEDLAHLEAKTVPTGPNSGCFLACMMRQVGLQDDTGMLHKETALEYAKTIFSDPEELKKAEVYIHSCLDVNDKDVSDGDKGCERALLLFECMMENASQFGFDV